MLCIRKKNCLHFFQDSIVNTVFNALWTVQRFANNHLRPTFGKPCYTLCAIFVWVLIRQNFAQYDLYCTRTLLEEKKKRNTVCQPTFVTSDQISEKINNRHVHIAVNIMAKPMFVQVSDIVQSCCGFWKNKVLLHCTKILCACVNKLLKSA